MAVNASKCNHLTPLHFKGLNKHVQHTTTSALLTPRMTRVK